MVAAVYFQFETLLTQVAQQIYHVTWQNWHRYIETKKVTHLSLRQVMAHFDGLHWQSCALLPISYCTPERDNDFQF